MTGDPSHDPSLSPAHSSRRPASAGFRGESDRRFAHGVHLIALAEGDAAIAPGYARGDARLRAAAPPATQSEPQALPQLAALLAGAEPPALDGAWFERRWSAGESAACLTAAERIAHEASAVPTGGLLDGVAVRVLVATPLRPDAIISYAPGDDDAPRSISLACGLETPGALAVLGAIAARLPDEPRLAEVLDADDVRRVRLHMAGSALSLALGDDPAIAEVLARACEVLLPPQHQGERTVALVERLARAGLLDQPPGEIERLGRGLARRYADRLHRAWRRGFFVPRGADVGAWVAALRSG